MTLLQKQDTVSCFLDKSMDFHEVCMWSEIGGGVYGACFGKVGGISIWPGLV